MFAVWGSVGLCSTSAMFYLNYRVAGLFDVFVVGKGGRSVSFLPGGEFSKIVRGSPGRLAFFWVSGSLL